MSGTAFVPQVATEPAPTGVIATLRNLARMLWGIIASPFRLFLSVRRSMTAASVTLLVISIVTLNIIWGYPWVGMFSVCLSLLVVGWVVNRIMRPNLSFNFTLPRSAPAGHPISIVVHGRNQGRLPAMDLNIAFSPIAGQLSKRRSSQLTSGPTYRVLSPPHALTMIEPGQRVDLPTSVAIDRRGIQVLPDVSVTSFFPFQLFRSFRRHPSQTQIAITPRPLDGDEDDVARGLLDAFGGWSHKLLSGDALDYTGSREYQVGMPVRRWDFTSWARLGRPIVREFQSPTIQLVSLIVDTSRDTNEAIDDDSDDPLLERVLSLAATAVLSLTQRLVRVRLCVTSEATMDQSSGMPMLTTSDCESMLIRLAAASSVPRDLADSRLAEVIEQIGRTPTLILTTRRDVSLPRGMPAGVTVLRIDGPHLGGLMGNRHEA